MLLYATVDDLRDWDSSITIPSDGDQLMRSGSIVVARAVNESLYDPATVATDERKDATCAQVVSWLSTGIRPGTGGLDSKPLVKSKGVDTARIDYDTSLAASVTAFQKREQIADELCPEAEAILRAAGLLWEPLPIWTQDLTGGLLAAGAESLVSHPTELLDWWR